jgi:hypothetical protein
MLLSTPYTEVYIKKSFLTSVPYLGQDETIFAILIGIRFTRGRAPLYVCFIPSTGALYDKVDQCAIFNRPETPEQRIGIADVGWWDSLSSKWQLLQIQALRGMDVEAVMRTGLQVTGTYLWTCDPQVPDETDYGQGGIWHEHKTKTYFFDYETGVLCCAPNNKMRFYDSSLSPKELDSPDWLKVYKDSNYPDRVSHEQNGYFGDSDNFNYE